MKRQTRSMIARICILHLLTLGWVLPAQAAMLPADAVEQQATSDDRVQVDQWLAREDVREQFAELGVDAGEIDARIAALSDPEIAVLAEQLEEQPAGGLLGVIGVVFIVLLILELVGVIDIFKNVGPAR